MLKEIRCNLFREPIVEFHEGLNVILGDDRASNSIGKSTMLMIIDFALGGDSYIRVNKDAIENLGNHQFEICYSFHNELLYFIRATDSYKSVYCCNEKYEKQAEIPLSSYTELLKEKYEITANSLSFRSAIGVYSRIWGKDNYDVMKPLQQHGSKAKADIITLIKIFGKYSLIETFERQIDKLTGQNTIINQASKEEFIPNVTQVIYRKNVVLIEELKKEVQEISSDIEATRINIKGLVSKEVIDLKNAKSQLIIKRNLVHDQLRKIRINLTSNKAMIQKQLGKLSEYFYDINIERLEQVHDFHSKMSNVLKDEMKQSEKELVQQLQIIEDDIKQIDKEINSKIQLKDAPKYTLERLIELAAKADQLKKANEIYERKTKIKKDLDGAKKDLLVIKADILSTIGNQINIKMYELSNIIHNDERVAPIFSIKENGYSLKGIDDTGTGKAYVSLVTFDLAILALTELPLLIHDTLLFKNVENLAIENIISIYNSLNKQVFIAIDEIHKFKNTTSDILQEKSVLSLNDKKTLFIKDWKHR